MGSLFSRRRGGGNGASSPSLGRRGQSSAALVSAQASAPPTVPSIYTKIMMLGHEGSGKKTLCSAMSGNMDGYFTSQHLHLNKLAEYTVTLSGPPRTPAALRGTMGVVVVYDVHDAESWKTAEGLAEFVQKNGMRHHVCYVIGNKREGHEAAVSTATASAAASKFGAKFFEVDSKADTAGVRRIFNSLYDDIIGNIVNAPPVHTISL